MQVEVSKQTFLVGKKDQFQFRKLNWLIIGLLWSEVSSIWRDKCIKLLQYLVRLAKKYVFP